ncbi:MAG TPA: DNA repair protein RadA [Candidatus Cryosericum sp.]|nr:DNA repair protein RadA [Candidatus Cryosericum sp.]
MAKDRVTFICGECGYESAKWMGKCPQCDSWNTMTESAQVKVKAAAPGSSVSQKLSKVTPLPQKRVSAGMEELDRVLGGGLLRGMAVLLGGDPGIGKSTLLLQAADALGKDGIVLYASGEESAAQIKLRADRLGMKNDIDILCETDLEHIIDEAVAVKCNVLIIDSIQTMFSEESAGAPGSVSQVRAATARLTRFAKDTGVVVFIVGHVTKDGNIAGPRVLEHIVDTVLYFEGDRHEGLRLLRAVKNRFGSTNEVGVFEMCDNGMKEVVDPSKLFLSGESAPGCAVTCAMEGSRPILAEVQALLTENAFGNPRRTSAGVDAYRLSLMLAVLEKKAHLKLSNKDVYLNVVGGLRLDERSTDLAVALCVASALMDVPLPKHTAALGEVGLTGEVRGVARIDPRLSECVRLGYSTVLVPKLTKKPKIDGLTIVPVSTVGEAIAYCYEKKPVV